MVAKNEGGMYVFGVTKNVTVVENSMVEEGGPIVYLTSLDGDQCFHLGVECAKNMVKYLSRFIEMAENGELSTKIKPGEEAPPAIDSPNPPARESRSETPTESIEEKADERDGGVSEGLETNSKEDEG